jgi:hypothetical protein
MSGACLKVLQICLDPVSCVILNRLCGGKEKRRSHVVRRLLYQAWAVRQAARRAPRLHVGRKKNGAKYYTIKNVCVGGYGFGAGEKAAGKRLLAATDLARDFKGVGGA